MLNALLEAQKWEGSHQNVQLAGVNTSIPVSGCAKPIARWMFPNLLQDAPCHLAITVPPFFATPSLHCGLCPFCPWWYLQRRHHAARVSSVLPVVVAVTVAAGTVVLGRGDVQRLEE